MRFGRCAFSALCSAVLPLNVFGYGVVSEYSGYTASGEDPDYIVQAGPYGPPDITILHPIDGRGPYDFDCLNAEGGAEVIGSLTALPGIGNVEVMIRGRYPSGSGPTDIWLVQIAQRSEQTPDYVGSLLYLKVSGSYGNEEHGATLVADSAHHPQIMQIEQIQKYAHANLRNLRNGGAESLRRS